MSKPSVSERFKVGIPSSLGELKFGIEVVVIWLSKLLLV